jgi:UDP-N-acetylglucosamine 2-epimerase
MKFVSVVGARPEFIQAMPVSQLLRSRHEEVLVHTGQHYDHQMSQRFFDELPIPAPAYNLAVGAGSHAQQTAEILTRLEPILLAEKPDAVIVRGDTNSTLGAALVASKLHLPLIHIEAGERSFNKAMPEEINRLLVDAIADLHFCVSQKAVKQLAAEGKIDSVHWVGDVMLDALRQMLPTVANRVALLDRLAIQSGRYGLLTIHRAANVENGERLQQIMTTFNQIEEAIIFPVHPRTRQAIAALGLPVADHIRLIEPVGYLDMLALAANARIIATDSGGLQREAFYLLTPCLTLRDETEWTETVNTGWNRLVGADPVAIRAAWQHFAPPPAPPPLLGDGTAAWRIVEILEETLGK